MKTIQMNIDPKTLVGWAVLIAGGAISYGTMSQRVTALERDYRDIKGDVKAIRESSHRLEIAFAKRNPPSSSSIENTQTQSVAVNTPDERETIKEQARLRGYYTRFEYAKLAGISTRTVDRQIESGKLEAEKDEETRTVKIPLSRL